MNLTLKTKQSLVYLISFLSIFLSSSVLGASEQIKLYDGNTEELWTIYVYGIGNVIFDVFNVLNLIVDDSEFITITITIALIGLLVAGWKYSEKFDPKILLGYFFGILIISYGIQGAKSDILIIDQYSSQGLGTTEYKVTEVPAIVAVPISLISSGIHEIQSLFSDAVSIPGNASVTYSNFSVGNKGFDFLSKILSSSQNIKITDPSLLGTFNEYFNQCVMYELYLGNIKTSTIFSSDNLLDTLKVSTASRYSQVTNTTGGVEMMTCLDTYNYIKEEMTVNSMIFANRSMSNISINSLGILPTSSLAAAYQAVGASTANGTNIATQNAIINAINGAYAQAAAATGTNDLTMAINTEQAKNAQFAGWATGAEVFSSVVVYLLGGIQALLFAILPLVLILSAIPSLGLKMLGNVFRMVLWLSLWPLGLEIVNFLSLSVSAPYYNQYTTTAGVTLGSTSGMTDATSKFTLVFSLISTMVPVLLYQLVNKMDLGLSEVLSRGSGAAAGAAAGAATVKGDVSYDSWRSNTTTAGKFDTAFQLTGGNQGSIIHNSANQGYINTDLTSSPNKTLVDGAAAIAYEQSKTSLQSTASTAANVIADSFQSLTTNTNSAISSNMKAFSEGHGSNFLFSSDKSKGTQGNRIDTFMKELSQAAGFTAGVKLTESNQQQVQAQLGLALRGQLSSGRKNGHINEKGELVNDLNNSDTEKTYGTAFAAVAKRRRANNGNMNFESIARAAQQEEIAKQIGDSNLSDEAKMAKIDELNQITGQEMAETTLMQNGFKKDKENGRWYRETGGGRDGGNKGKEYLMNDKGELSEAGEKAFKEMGKKSEGHAKDSGEFWTDDRVKTLLNVADAASMVLMFTGPGALIGGVLKGASMAARVGYLASNKVGKNLLTKAVSKELPANLKKLRPAKSNYNKDAWVKKQKKQNEQAYKHRKEKGKNTPKKEAERGSLLKKIGDRLSGMAIANVSGSYSATGTTGAASEKGATSGTTAGDKNSNGLSIAENLAKSEKLVNAMSATASWLETNGYGNTSAETEATTNSTTAQHLLSTVKGLTESLNYSTKTGFKDFNMTAAKANRLSGKFEAATIEINGFKIQNQEYANRLKNEEATDARVIGDGTENHGLEDVSDRVKEEVNKGKVDAQQIYGSGLKKEEFETQFEKDTDKLGKDFMDKENGKALAIAKSHEMIAGAKLQDLKDGLIFGGIKAMMEGVGGDLGNVDNQSVGSLLNQLNDMEVSNFNGLDKISTSDYSYQSNRGHVFKVGDGKDAYFAAMNNDGSMGERLSNDNLAEDYKLLKDAYKTSPNDPVKKAAFEGIKKDFENAGIDPKTGKQNDQSVTTHKEEDGEMGKTKAGVTNQTTGAVNAPKLPSESPALLEPFLNKLTYTGQRTDDGYAVYKNNSGGRFFRNADNQTIDANTGQNVNDYFTTGNNPSTETLKTLGFKDNVAYMNSGHFNRLQTNGVENLGAGEHKFVGKGSDNKNHFLSINGKETFTIGNDGKYNVDEDKFVPAESPLKKKVAKTL